MPNAAIKKRAAGAREANQLLETLEERFRSAGRPIEVKFRDLCSSWPWAKRSDVYTHLIHRYSAKILPYIPILFLSSDLYVEPGEPVADVFAGTGTVLLESSIHPFFPRPSYGIEINPLARLIAQVKVTPLEPAGLRLLADDIAAITSASPRADIPSYSQIDYWFPAPAQRGLGRVKRVIDHHVRSAPHRDFFRICLAATVRKCSFADPEIPPPVRLRPEKYAPNSERRSNAERHLHRVETHDPITVFLACAKRNIARMEHFWRAWQTHPSPQQARIVWDDATSLRRAGTGERGELMKRTSRPFPDGSCGAVITSPPYGTAQKYVRNTKLEMLWLGLIREDEISSLDRRSIGTEKALWSEYSNIPKFPNTLIHETIQRIARRSQYRAALTYKYFSGLRDTIHETYRILRDDGHLIMVIGDNVVSGIPVANHELLTALANEAGFTLRMLLRDSLQSRGMITTRHHTGGLVTDDWVVVLQKQH